MPSPGLLKELTFQTRANALMQQGRQTYPKRPIFTPMELHLMRVWFTWGKTPEEFVARIVADREQECPSCQRQLKRRLLDHSVELQFEYECTNPDCPQYAEVMTLSDIENEVERRGMAQEQRRISEAYGL